MILKIKRKEEVYHSAVCNITPEGDSYFLYEYAAWSFLIL